MWSSPDNVGRRNFRLDSLSFTWYPVNKRKSLPTMLRDNRLKIDVRDLTFVQAVNKVWAEWILPHQQPKVVISQMAVNSTSPGSNDIGTPLSNLAPVATPVTISIETPPEQKSPTSAVSNAELAAKLDKVVAILAKLTNNTTLDKTPKAKSRTSTKSTKWVPVLRKEGVPVRVVERLPRASAKGSSEVGLRTWDSKEKVKEFWDVLPAKSEYKRRQRRERWAIHFERYDQARHEKMPTQFRDNLPVYAKTKYLKETTAIPA